MIQNWLKLCPVLPWSWFSDCTLCVLLLRPCPCSLPTSLKITINLPVNLLSAAFMARESKLSLAYTKSVLSIRIHTWTPSVPPNRECCVWTRHETIDDIMKHGYTQTSDLNRFACLNVNNFVVLCYTQTYIQFDYLVHLFGLGLFNTSINQ